MKLIVFTGLPGTGKTAIAESIGRSLGIPVFAKDWLEATLLRSELVAVKTEKSLGAVGYDLLTTLAERQFMLGQSVILDSVASTQSIRTAWRTLAEQYHAEWRVIECICSDETLQRSRLEVRQRHIPNWHELTWADIEHVRSYYAKWDEARLLLDAAHPLAENIEKALAYCNER